MSLIHGNDRRESSGGLDIPGNGFFLRLAPLGVRDVSVQRDENGLT